MMKLRSGRRAGRTLAHSRIKNFLKCNESSGTDVFLENGAAIRDAALDTGTDSNGVILSTDAAFGSTLVGGSWDDMTSGLDSLHMLLYKVTGSAGINFGFGAQPKQNIHAGGGGVTTSALVGSSGSHGSREVSTQPNVGTSGEITRLVWKGTYGMSWEYSLGSGGTDVSFTDGAIISGEDRTSWEESGELTDFGNTYGMVVGAGGDTLTLYGFVSVEFPNGFPSDIDARINKTFDAWEAGNKIHFPIYEDE